MDFAVKEHLDWSYIEQGLKRHSILENKSKDQDIKLTMYKDKAKLEMALEELEEARLYLEGHGDIEGLKIYDIKEYLESCTKENSYLESEDLLKIEKTLSSARKIYSNIKKSKTKTTLLKKVVLEFNSQSELERLINTSIDKEGKIKYGANEQLTNLSDSIRHESRLIEDKLSKILDNKWLKWLVQDKIVTKRHNRYVIPIKQELRRDFKGIIIDKSNSEHTVFMEPYVAIEANNNLVMLNKRLEMEKINLLKQLSSILKAEKSNLESLLEGLKHFNIIWSKAKLCIELNCTKPDINSSGYFNIEGARHPLLGKKASPINLVLGKEYNILILTGPNGAGKTLALKTLGLMVLMCLHGFGIPAAKGSMISLVDNIYIELGDSQDIGKGLSSFSGHISSISKILKEATKQSLVLIDELALGTDPTEGNALALAIVEEFKLISCKTLISTHYKSFREYSLLDDGRNKLMHASCLIDRFAGDTFGGDNKQGNYKLVYGKASKSDALAVAKLMGLEDKILSRAREFLEGELSNNDKLIEKLIDFKSNLEEKQAGYERMLCEVKNKEIKLKAKEQRLQKRELSLKENIINKELRILKDIRKEAFTKFKEISKLHENETAKTKLQGIENSFVKVKKLKDALKVKDISEKEGEETLNQGDIVIIPKLNKKGKVLNVDKKRVIVDVNSLKIGFPKEDVKRCKEEELKEKKEKEKVITYSKDINSPPYELNIIGRDSETATKLTNKYIENLSAYDREYGKIIHGYGKGILRNIIVNILKEHKLIKDFSNSNKNHGGLGVTLFTLK